LVSKVPYAIRIKHEVIIVLNVADPIHTTDRLTLMPCVNYLLPKNKVLCVISGFCSEVDENCTLLGYHYLLCTNPEESSSQYNAWLTHKLRTRKLSYSDCLTCCVPLITLKCICQFLFNPLQKSCHFRWIWWKWLKSLHSIFQLGWTILWLF